jgi:putative oxidoreductase
MMSSLNLGLLLLRLVVGGILTAHGVQKLFGWFGGAGFAKTMHGFGGQGLKPARLWTTLAVLGEVGGGMSLVLGLLTPLGAAGVCGAMMMAIFKTHWRNGFWNSKRGYEYPLALLGSATALGLTGPGVYAVDTVIGSRLPTVPLFVALTIIAGVVDVIGIRMSHSPATGVPPATQAP